ncbi:MAG TPA: prohibitin family protein [Candidatus Obscuribacterales bacterium]
MYQQNSFWTGKKIAGAVVAAFALLFLIITGFKSFVTVEKGHVGVVMNWGAVDNKPLDPGLHLVVPFKQTVEEMSTQLKSFEVTASAASKDLQPVTTKISIQHSINGAMAPQALQNVGGLEQIDLVVVKPAIEESLKAVTAKHTAEELVTKREAVKALVTQAITAYIDHTLDEKGIKGALHIANVAITDFQFSPDFNKAIEDKVKAEQDALRAENDKRKRVIDAEAKAAEQKLAADAQAYQIEKESVARAQAIKREADALAQNPNLIQLRAVEKWNGQLPTFSGSSPVPFINVTPPQK